MAVEVRLECGAVGLDAGDAAAQRESERRKPSARFAATEVAPRRLLVGASNEWPKATPMFLRVEESVRSRCRREVTRVAASVSSSAQEISKFASAFSKRMGLTLWGIVDEPVEPWAARFWAR